MHDHESGSSDCWARLTFPRSMDDGRQVMYRRLSASAAGGSTNEPSGSVSVTIGLEAPCGSTSEPTDSSNIAQSRQIQLTWPNVKAKQTVVGRNGETYTVSEDKVLGKGYFGRVYPLESGCVLKLFGIPEGDSRGHGWDELMVEMLRERTILQNVSNLSGVVKYVTHGTDEHLGPFIITEPACPLSFKDVIKQCKRARAEDKPMPFTFLSLLANMCQLAATVDAIHSRAVIHSDISPRNVLRTEGGSTLLIDFGVGVEKAPDTFMFRAGFWKAFDPPMLRALIGKAHAGEDLNELVERAERVDWYLLGKTCLLVFTYDDSVDAAPKWLAELPPVSAVIASGIERALEAAWPGDLCGEEAGLVAQGIAGLLGYDEPMRASEAATLFGRAHSLMLTRLKPFWPTIGSMLLTLMLPPLIILLRWCTSWILAVKGAFYWAIMRLIIIVVDLSFICVIQSGQEVICASTWIRWSIPSLVILLITLAANGNIVSPTADWSHMLIRSEEMYPPPTTMSKANLTGPLLHTIGFFIEEHSVPSSLGCFPVSLDTALVKCAADATCSGVSFCSSYWLGAASTDMACLEGSLSTELAVGRGCDGYYKDVDILDAVDIKVGATPSTTTVAIFASCFAVALFLPVLGFIGSICQPRLALRLDRGGGKHGLSSLNYVHELSFVVCLLSCCFALFLRTAILDAVCPAQPQVAYQNDDDILEGCGDRRSQVATIRGLAWTWSVLTALTVATMGVTLRQRDVRYVDGYSSVEFAAMWHMLNEALSLKGRCRRPWAGPQVYSARGDESLV